jgi:hypothetical protein
MGNDGGSVPVRCEQVKLKKKDKPIDTTEKDRLKYLTCAISRESLVGKQAACDRLGNLFDKHSVMKCMIEKNVPPQFSHLHGLKDLINVNFTKNEEYQDNKEAQLGSVDSFVSPFACPLTTRPVNGKYKFCALTTCGHVFSAKGLESSKEGAIKECYVCLVKYTDNDIITLNPSDEEKQAMNNKMLELKKDEKENKRKLKETKEQTGEKKKKDGEQNEGEQKTKKRKVMRTADAGVSRASLVQGGLQVKSALKKASEGHDQQKKLSTTYQSIFSNPEDKSSGMHMTGVYLK